MAEYGPLTEKEYYTLSERNSFTKAENDIYDGKLRICDIPFEYRSLPNQFFLYPRIPQIQRFRLCGCPRIFYHNPQRRLHLNL